MCRVYTLVRHPPPHMTHRAMIRQKLGLVQVYTGNGKGKTTAALGLAMRAYGYGLNVKIIQFLKPDVETGERNCASDLGIEFVSIGANHMDGTPVDMRTEGELTAEAMELARRDLASGSYDLVVLDEIVNSIRLGVLPVEDVIDLLDSKAEHTEVVLTGRGAPQELIDRADLVTEMRLVKHPFDKGVPARRGIEF